jgi:hypothetical protein
VPLQWWYTLGVVEDIGRIDARLGPDEPIEVLGGEVGPAQVARARPTAVAADPFAALAAAAVPRSRLM